MTIVHDHFKATWLCSTNQMGALVSWSSSLVRCAQVCLVSPHWPCTIEIAWVDLGRPYHGSYKQRILANRGQKVRSRSTGVIQSCMAIKHLDFNLTSSTYAEELINYLFHEYVIWITLCLFIEPPPGVRWKTTVGFYLGLLEIGQNPLKNKHDILALAKVPYLSLLVSGSMIWIRSHILARPRL